MAYFQSNRLVLWHKKLKRMRLEILKALVLLCSLKMKFVQTHTTVLELPKIKWTPYDSHKKFPKNVHKGKRTQALHYKNHTKQSKNNTENCKCSERANRKKMSKWHKQILWRASKLGVDIKS